ncbi:MAG: MFS transporter [Gammaproteobacteria bacterium]|nr:MFS transporter [Gammaproteobacteria bacterium]
MTVSSGRYLVAAGISFYGDWLTTVALVVLLFRATGSATAPALYMLVRVAPRVFGPTPGGVVSDRFGPARVATVCLLLQGILTASLVLLARGNLIWAIYPFVAAAQFINSLSQPAYGALLPRVTRPSQLGRVNGIYGGLFASSILVSPALGALLLPHLAPEALIAVDALTFLVASALIATLPVGPAPQSETSSARRRRPGWQALVNDAVLRSGTAAAFGSAAVVTALQAVLVVAASQHFGHDTYVGWLYAAVGAGSLVGSALFLRPNPARIRRRDLVILALGEVIPLAGFVFLMNLVLATLFLFVSSFSAMVYQTLGNIALQQRVAADLLGRANGAMRLAMYSGMFVGALASVALVGPFGWQPTVIAVSLAAIVVLAVASLTGPRDRRVVTPLTDLPD